MSKEDIFLYPQISEIFDRKTINNNNVNKSETSEDVKDFRKSWQKVQKTSKFIFE